MNRVKDVLLEGKAAIGAAAFIEDDSGFLAGSGFDFLLFDTQHAPVEIKELRRAISAMRAREAIRSSGLEKTGLIKYVMSWIKARKGLSSRW